MSHPYQDTFLEISPDFIQWSKNQFWVTAFQFLPFSSKEKILVQKDIFEFMNNEKISKLTFFSSTTGSQKNSLPSSLPLPQLLIFTAEKGLSSVAQFLS